jgi:beta-xylosidase
MGADGRPRVIRRDLLKGTAAAGLAGLAGAPGAAAGCAAAPSGAAGSTTSAWPISATAAFLNPVLSGDRPDPAILKDGEDYYATFSTFDSYPGLLIWHSRDLVNWQPRKPALERNIGSVWAPACTRTGAATCSTSRSRRAERHFRQLGPSTSTGRGAIPTRSACPRHIDPCHAVAEDGSRWLFLSGGDRVQLAADNLSLAGEVEHVYDPWRYPDDWVVEGFSPEGPKIHRIGGWFYMLTAVGGTAGPPTGHMVIAARCALAARAVGASSGPTRWCARQRRGSLVVARPRLAGRRARRRLVVALPRLRERPVDARAPVPARSGRVHPRRLVPDDRRRPVATAGQARRRGGAAARHGAVGRLFGASALGSKWSLFRPEPGEAGRVRVADGALHFAGKGEAPSSGSPLLLTAGDPSYRFECDIEVAPGGRAGLVLFYDDRLYAGLGFDASAS